MNDHLPSNVTESLEASQSRSIREREMMSVGTDEAEEKRIFSQLNPKQVSFVHALIENKLDVAKAGSDAGYSKSYSFALMKQLPIREAYTYLMNQRSFHAVMGMQEVLAYATDVIRGNEFDQMINPRTGEVVDLRVSAHHRSKYVEFLLKHHGVLMDKQFSLNNNGSMTIKVDIEDFYLEDEPLQKDSRKDVTEDVIDVLL